MEDKCTAQKILDFLENPAITRGALWVGVFILAYYINVRLVPLWSAIWQLRGIELQLVSGVSVATLVGILLRVAGLDNNWKNGTVRLLKGRPLPFSVIVLLCLVCACSHFRADVEHRAEDAFSKGVENSRSGDYHGAMENFDYSIALLPFAGENTYKRGAAYYYQRAMAYEELGRVSEAINDYHQAREIDIKLQQATTQLAGLYVDDGKCEQAIKLFSPKVPAHAPALDYAALVALGRAYICIGAYEHAEERLRTAITMEAGYPQAHYYLGEAFEGLGECKDKVCDEFESVLRYEQLTDLLRAMTKRNYRRLNCGHGPGR